MLGSSSSMMAVVDAELRVHGLEGLRVIGASIMPTVIRGHTNAPAIMIAEKAADLVGGKTQTGAQQNAGHIASA